MLMKGAVIRLFSLLCSISLYDYTTIYFTTLILVAIWVASSWVYYDDVALNILNLTVLT